MTASAIIAETDVIAASNAKVRAYAQAILDETAPVTPPVIVRKLTTVTPDDVPGASDQEKVVNAHAEAVSRGIPFRWNRRVLVTRIGLTENHDGLEIVADPDCGPVLSERLTNHDGLLYHLLPSAGKHVEVTMRGVSILGNRANTQPGTTQNAITLGNPGAGTARVILDGCTLSGFRGAGVIVWADDCEVIAVNTRSLDNGDCGFGTTRGRMYLIGCEAARCAVGFNPSAGEFSHLSDCWSHHNFGNGLKVSERSGGGDFPTRLQITGMRIENNAGVGLTSTSASVGSVITGNRIAFARNAQGALNLTDATEGRFGSVTSIGDGPADTSDTVAAFLMSGNGRMRFASLDIRGAQGRGVNGGWGRSLSIGRLSIDGCAGPGLRWVHAPIVYDEYIKGSNGGPDELVNNV